MQDLQKLVQNNVSFEISLRYSLLHFFCSIGLMLMPLALLPYSLSISFSFALILYPVVIFRSFALMHDASHGSASKHKLCNHLVGVLAGSFCFLPYAPWRGVHLDHHRWAGNVDRDPVMKIVRDFHGYGAKKKALIEFCWKYWLPLAAFMQYVVFWGECLKRMSKNENASERVLNVISFLSPLLCCVAIVKLFGVLAFMYMVPAFYVYLVMVEVVNFPHHLCLPQSRGDGKISFIKQYSIARSCHYHQTISKFVLNNFNYHVEHHMFPYIPWFALKDVSVLVKNYLGDEYNMSESHDWILENKKVAFEELLLTSVEVNEKSLKAS